jgi:hypothetical protein
MAQARSHGVLGPPLGQVRPDVTTDTETILTGLEKFHDDFDFKAPEFSDRFGDVMDELVTQCPVAHGNTPNKRFDAGTEHASDQFWVVTSFEELRRCARESELFSKARGGMLVERPPGFTRHIRGVCNEVIDEFIAGDHRRRQRCSAAIDAERWLTDAADDETEITDAQRKTTSENLIGAQR